MSIKTASYAAIHEKYLEAIEWMADLGVKLGANRLTHYEKVVRYWKENYRLASENEGKEVFPDFVSSVFEIQDFIDVYTAFKDVRNECERNGR